MLDMVRHDNEKNLPHPIHQSFTALSCRGHLLQPVCAALTSRVDRLALCLVQCRIGQRNSFLLHSTAKKKLPTTRGHRSRRERGRGRVLLLEAAATTPIQEDVVLVFLEVAAKDTAPTAVNTAVACGGVRHAARWRGLGVRGATPEICSARRRGAGSRRGGSRRCLTRCVVR